MGLAVISGFSPGRFDTRAVTDRVPTSLRSTPPPAFGAGMGAALGVRGPALYVAPWARKCEKSDAMFDARF